MNRIREAFVAAAVISGMAGCNSSLAPPSEIELRTEVDPAVVVVNDTVTIRAIMRNTTGSVLKPGQSCGPPVLFELRHSGDNVVHPVPLDVPFTCAGLDYHVLEPFETDTVMIRWRAVLTRGDWKVRSGYRNGASLERLTAAVALRVE